MLNNPVHFSIHVLTLSRSCNVRFSSRTTTTSAQSTDRVTHIASALRFPLSHKERGETILFQRAGQAAHFRLIILKEIRVLPQRGKPTSSYGLALTKHKYLQKRYLEYYKNFTNF